MRSFSHHPKSHKFRHLLSALILCTSLCAQNLEVLNEFKIGLVGKDQADPSYQATLKGAKDAALKFSKENSIDVEVVMLTPKRAEGEDQITALGELFIAEADGLIVSPTNAEYLLPSIQFAMEQNQEIVLIENGIENAQPLATLLCDEKEAGRQAAKALMPMLTSLGRVAILMNENPTQSELERLSGIRATLGYRRIETIIETPANYADTLQSIAKTMQSESGDAIEAWIFLNGAPFTGMPNFPWEPGRVHVVAIESSPSTLIYIDHDYLEATVTHPFYDWGYQSIELLVQKLHFGTIPEKKTILTPTTVIDWSNLEDYRSQWSQWLQ